jgi:hypothetical protein
MLVIGSGGGEKGTKRHQKAPKDTGFQIFGVKAKWSL